MKQRGSAILIAVFLVAAVGSAAFAIGRLFLMDASISEKYESSVIAYYAAESGIEEGLLRYRYDKNQEVDTENNVIDLDSTASNPRVALASIDPIKRYYKPSISYLQSFYGEDINSDRELSHHDLNDVNYPKEYIIQRDESIKIDISKLNAADHVMFFVKFIDDNGNNSIFNSLRNDNPFVEVSLVGQTPLSDRYQMKAVLVANGYTNNFQSSGFIESNGKIDGTHYYHQALFTIRTINSSGIFDPNVSKELIIKPLYSNVKFGIQVYGLSRDVMPKAYNTVKSTGYYGGVTRTLEAKIDRQAGTVYDLFDFVLYRYQ